MVGKKGKSDPSNSGSVQSIIPRNETHWLELRAQDITSTESPALFGLSPYSTAFELWHRKRNSLVVKIEENERMKWGKRLQDSIATGIAQDMGWTIRPMIEYLRDPQERLGSSFDFAIGDDGLLEVKNVDSLAYRDGWIEDGESVEAPPHIEVQVQHQLAVSGRKYAYIGALVGGNTIVLIKREPDPNVISLLKSKVSDFWKSIKSNTPPTPVFERDAKFISSLYSNAEAGKVVIADEEITELAAHYKKFAQEEKEIQVHKEVIKARILSKIEDAEKVRGETFSISAGMISATKVSYERQGYRNFKINWKKIKESS